MTPLTLLQARREHVRKMLDWLDDNHDALPAWRSAFDFYMGQLEAVNCILNGSLGKPLPTSPLDYVQRGGYMVQSD